jgi:hypothetical protein
MNDSLEFARQWFHRSQKSFDDFEKFIFLYLCLAVIAKDWAMKNGISPSSGEDADEGWFVCKYFSSHLNSHNIIELVEPLESFSRFVAQKNESGDYIVYSHNTKDQAHLKNLYNHYKAIASINEKDRSTALGVAIKAVRNNLFHGVKLYEKKRDILILALVTPTLD